MFQLASYFEPITQVVYRNSFLLLESQSFFLQGDHYSDYYVNSMSIHSPEPVWCGHIYSISFHFLLTPFKEVTVQEWAIFLWQKQI